MKFNENMNELIKRNIKAIDMIRICKLYDSLRVQNETLIAYKP